MKGTNHHTRHDEHRDRIATLVRSVSVRLVEVSRGGCRLECSSRLESGTSGLLAVELAGLMRVDDIRVARCEARAGAGAVFQLGAELLTTRRLGRRSLRMAVRNIISDDMGVGHARQDDEEPTEAIRSGTGVAVTDHRERRDDVVFLHHGRSIMNCRRGPPHGAQGTRGP